MRLFAPWVLMSPILPAASGELTITFGFSVGDTCPASFDKQDGGCVLRSRYRGYRSLRDAGVGGLKTGLPPLREGFTPQQIDLGRYLFFAPALSADGSVSCASCHDPAQGFADGRGRAVGIQRADTATLCTEPLERWFSLDIVVGWLKKQPRGTNAGPALFSR